VRSALGKAIQLPSPPALRREMLVDLTPSLVRRKDARVAKGSPFSGRQS